MRVRLVLFGRLKDFAAAESWHDVPQDARVQDVLDSLRANGSLPEALLRASAIAVNRVYAQPETLLQDGDEVAVLPPVSGGLR
jgi:molybdopterin converting factor small subunit